MAPHSSTLAWKIPWTTTHLVPLPMEFSRREYWSGLPLDSTLKSRDITLLTKVHRAKAMVFSGVKAGPYRRLSAEELMLLNCGA